MEKKYCRIESYTLPFVRTVRYRAMVKNMDVDTLISRAMSEIAKRRVAEMPKERRVALATHAAKARWQRASVAEKRATVKRLQEQLAKARRLRRAAAKAAAAPEP